MMEPSNLALATPSIDTLITVNAGWTLLAYVCGLGLVIVIKMWPDRTNVLPEPAYFFLRDGHEWLHALLLALIPAYLTWTTMTLNSGLRDLMPMASAMGLVVVGLLATMLAGFGLLMLAQSLEPKEVPQGING